MAIVQLTAPASEPVTDAEASDHLRVDSGDEWALIASLIVAARQRAEAYTELAFVSRSFGMYLDRFPSGAFRVPCAPLVSVESIKYYDANNVEQTLSPSDYYVDAISKPGRITPATSWPGTYSRPNAVSIVLTAGFGTPADVPQVIKQAMLLMIGDMHEHREDTVAGNMSSLPVTAEMLLRPFRLLG
jgi:uncharacterized phiE125 gp8 family phage protein